MLGDNQARLAQRSVLKKAGSNLIDSRAFNNVQLDEQFGSGTENIDDSHVILPKPLASGVQIFITGHMNVTIDSRYCIERRLVKLTKLSLLQSNYCVKNTVVTLEMDFTTCTFRFHHTYQQYRSTCNLGLCSYQSIFTLQSIFTAT